MVQGTREATVTHLLQQWSCGDRKAAEEVLPLVYDELRRIAASQLRQERSEHTLQATAIVHEAYLRLSEQSGLRWPSRSHFYAFAAHLIRRVLVDHARIRGDGKQEKQLSQCTHSLGSKTGPRRQGRRPPPVYC